MVIQKVSLPLKEVCGSEELYFHQGNNSIPFTYSDDGAFYLQQFCVADFESFFNSFSTGKWRRYTTLQGVDLQLTYKGKVEVTLFQKTKIQLGIMEKICSKVELESESFQQVRLPFGDLSGKGCYCFTILCLSKAAVVKDICYVSHEQQQLTPVHIILDICTFKREMFVKNNIKKISTEILNNPESPLYGHLTVYVTDNGKTLQAADLSCKEICLFQNLNAGGVAGFTRGIIETLRNQKQTGATHVILMDDDVVIDPETLERTYIFLQYLKVEYQQSFIGGSMLRLDEPYRQHEMGGYIHDNDYIMMKNRYDLRNKIVVLDNEIAEGAEVAAWWYCCIPLSVARKDNLPLPIFFHKDDMEYSMRNDSELIVMNGISVWHQPFEGKSSSHIKYYDARNLLILAALRFDRKQYKKRDALKYLSGQIKWHISCYRYKEAELILQGIQDFFRGVDWIANLDAEKQLAELLKLGYKKYPLEKLEISYDRGSYEESIPYNEGWLHHIIRKLTLNGYLLPARRKSTAVVPAFYPHATNFFRVKKVLNYEDTTKTGYITVKSYREAFRVAFRFFHVYFLVLTRYESMCREYRSEFRTITNEAFWKHYLGIN